MPRLKKQILQMGRVKAGNSPVAIARLKAEVEVITPLPELLLEDAHSPPHSTTRHSPTSGTSSTIRSPTDMDIDTTRQCKKTPGVTTNSGIRSPPDPSSPDVGTAKTSTEFPPFPIYHG